MNKRVDLRALKMKNKTYKLNFKGFSRTYELFEYTDSGIFISCLKDALMAFLKEASKK